MRFPKDISFPQFLATFLVVTGQQAMRKFYLYEPLYLQLFPLSNAPLTTIWGPFTRVPPSREVLGGLRRSWWTHSVFYLLSCYRTCQFIVFSITCALPLAHSFTVSLNAKNLPILLLKIFHHMLFPTRWTDFTDSSTVVLYIFFCLSVCWSSFIILAFYF